MKRTAVEILSAVSELAVAPATNKHGPAGQHMVGHLCLIQLRDYLFLALVVKTNNFCVISDIYSRCANIFSCVRCGIKVTGLS